MNKSLITKKELKKLSVKEKILKALLIMNLLKDEAIKVAKLVAIVMIITYIYNFSKIATTYVMNLSANVIQTIIFSTIVITIMFVYLKVCEEVKGEH